jgi:esterase/lipase
MNYQGGNKSDFMSLVLLLGEATMMKSIVAISAAVFAIASASALAADMMDPFSQMLMKPMTPAETAQLKAERNAAKSKWATMTPEEKAGVTRSMRSKKLADLNVMERVAQEDDMIAMSKADSAQLKADRDAARAKFAQMSAEEKAAVRKAAREKKLSDLTVMERVGQENDMKQFMSY